MLCSANYISHNQLTRQGPRAQRESSCKKGKRVSLFGVKKLPLSLHKVPKAI